LAQKPHRPASPKPRPARRSRELASFHTFRPQPPGSNLVRLAQSAIRNPTTPSKADAGCPVPFRQSAIGRLGSFPEAGHRGDVAHSTLPMPARLPQIGFVPHFELHMSNLRLLLNWLCFAKACRMYYSPQLLPRQALALLFGPAEIGFVWRRRAPAGSPGHPRPWLTTPAKLGSFGAFALRPAPRSPDTPARPGLALFPEAGHRGDVARIFTTGAQRSGSGLRHEAKRFNREIRQIREGSPQLASLFAWFASFAVTFFSCAFKSSITNHQFRRATSGWSIPLPWGRVARIVTEFRAQTTPERCITPCVRRNKEFLGRGVFYLRNCCTNVAVF
jgi:hypothetical protein